MKRAALITSLALLATAPPSLAAEISTDSTDPAGDSLGTAAQDITRISASRNADGYVAASVTFSAPHRTTPTFVLATVGTWDGTRCQGNPGVGLYAFTDGTIALYSLNGASGVSAGRSDSTSTIAFAGNASALSAWTPQCLDVVVTARGDSSQILDTASTFFPGFTPAQAPTPTPIATPAPTPTPAPAPQGPIVVCVVPRLKGKTIAKAIDLLADTECELGKIKGPKARKGYRRVVSKAKISGDGLAVDLTVKLKRK